MVASGPPYRLLVLGGTTEASRLAGALAGRPDLAPTLSLAGRTAAPAPPPIPYRIGGFGGAEGLGRYLEDNRIQAVVDATHPFATRIAANARAACAGLGVPLAVYARPPWRAGPEDRWETVGSLEAAAIALGPAPLRVFLTTGRLGLGAFRTALHHHYLIRTIDPPNVADLPPDHAVVSGRGPFRADQEAELMRRERIDVLVSKNSGGASGKLEAARALALRTVMVEPPRHPPGVMIELDAVLDWIEAQRITP